MSVWLNENNVCQVALIILSVLTIFLLFCTNQNFKGSVDAFHVNAVDTTGAGDSFVGALLGKIVDDQSILEVSIQLLVPNNQILAKFFRKIWKWFI
jgi:fructose-1-phosphate kinase PfkB-like protein